MKSFLLILTMLFLFTEINIAEASFDYRTMECEDVKSGSVAFSTGQQNITIFIDDFSDELSFTTTTDTGTGDFSFTYVVTDSDGKILGIPPGNTVDFNPAGLGVCNVYGLAYTGMLNIAVDDNLLEVAELSTECFDLSDNKLSVNRISPMEPSATFFVSSNTSAQIGVYEVIDGNGIVASSFMSNATDADGIYYDEVADVLYQLNRTDNVINAYSNVSTALAAGMAPELTATSTSDFTNGREIAFTNGKLIVADDVTDANQFVIYNATPTAITLDRVITTDINLWGIFISGNTLYAVEDNSNNVAIYDDIFNQSGMVSPSQSISVEGLVRTHGLVYVADVDMMLLTDVGDADSAIDGAIVRIKGFTKAAADGMISTAEQIRVEGGSSLLGNPVDIAYDNTNNRVYVAERKRNGGMVLGFKLPVKTGGIAPVYAQIFEGASAIHLPGVEVDGCVGIDGGTVMLAGGGTETTIIVDGNPDFISFSSNINPTAHAFTYVVTDAAGIILGIPPGNMVDFDPAGLGVCNVYGLSYVGSLNIEVGNNFFEVGLEISDVCWDVSDNFLSINRIDPQPSDVQFYLSSNTSGLVSVFSELEDGEIVMSAFESMAMDADGLFYDESSDALYQLNRTDNVINAYSDVRSSLANGMTPPLTATSTSDFTNGREIAYHNGKIVVAEDGTDNKFIIYNASPTSITLDKILDADINLWGIHANGNTLYAVEDNSNRVATFENFFDNAAGPVSPTSMASIDGLVRTHGLTYIEELDMMLLTDIGDADSGTDGAIVRISKYTMASSDGTVTAAEQIRVEGGSSLLGNPVDIAYDRTDKRVYVAERKRNGGMLLGFKLPVKSGGIAPVYSKMVAGASAIHFPGNGAPPCDNIEAGMVSLATGGTETTIIIDGIADMISFNSTGASTNTNFTYVVTDEAGIILGIPPADTVDFDPAGIGLCRVYGVAYVGSLNIKMGDNFLAEGLEIATKCADVSDNSLTINRIAVGASDLRFYTSSNTSGQIGAFSILDNNAIAMAMFDADAGDADGIYYDKDTDVIYQLNRTDNRIDLYADVQASMDMGMVPTLLTSSTSDFSNGREIAVIDNQLVVAQDEADGNDGNKLVVYDITATSITFNREHSVDINLWGIFATGNTLFAVEDNSNNVAVYSDFFNMPAGPLTPTNLVTVDDLVRTHGIIYDYHEDMLVLTDIGDAGSDANDGAIVVIRNFTDVSADGVVSSDEQARAFGGSSQLANPVDITLDKPNKRVYVAERKRGGGMIYAFKLPKLTGGIAPEWSKGYPGASAIHLPGLEVGICEIADGGVIELATGGTEATIFIDGDDDNISFTTSVPAEPIAYNFTYVVTDSVGMILDIPTGNTVEFNGAGLGTCYVYGLSYVGDLNIMPGMDLFAEGLEISTECADLSDNRLTINRIEPENGVAYLFASSNTDNRTAAFRILANNAVVSDFFFTNATDAEGIAYDNSANVLYQVNRSTNVLEAYNGLDAYFNTDFNFTPTVSATSSSDFMNGRGIARMGDKIVVAQDATDMNGGNKFFVYSANAIEITLDKVLNADINLWGIFADRNTLIAVQDNSNNIAIYDNFLTNPAGSVTPSDLVSVENLVRTHGLTYDDDSDMMFLTDIGDADSGTDGAIVVINNWSDAIVDGMIEMGEQIRIEGDTTLLGNPVDIAYDRVANTIYVAERKNNGGRILGFDMLDIAAGEYKPNYIYNFAGVSAVEISEPIAPLNEFETVDRNITTRSYSLYPSPASESINLALESEVSFSTIVQIFDMTGKLMMSEQISVTKGENVINVNVSNLGSGFHVVQIPSIGYSDKFLKIK